jgi:hypothetical protein
VKRLVAGPIGTPGRWEGFARIAESQSAARREGAGFALFHLRNSALKPSAPEGRTGLLAYVPECCAPFSAHFPIEPVEMLKMLKMPPNPCFLELTANLAEVQASVRFR